MQSWSEEKCRTKPLFLGQCGVRLGVRGPIGLLNRGGPVAGTEAGPVAGEAVPLGLTTEAVAVVC